MTATQIDSDNAAGPHPALGAPENPTPPIVSSDRLEYLARRRRHAVVVMVARLALAVGFVGLWEVAARRRWTDPLLTSQPSKVWSKLWSLASSGELWTHTRVTLIETVGGFIAAMLIGLAVAAALWWSPTVGSVLEPFLVIANALPKIALGPILYVWLGSKTSVYGMAIAISVVVTILMIFEGFRAVDPHKIKLLRTFGAGRLKVLRYVVLPEAIPSIVATAKVTIGLTLVGVIVGEFLSSEAGLGYLILYGSQVFQMNLVMASIVMLLIISTLMYVVAGWCERLLLRSR